MATERPGADHWPRSPFFAPFEYDFDRALAETHRLTDVFRHLHPDESEYSWLGRAGDGYRHDHAFCCQSLTGRRRCRRVSADGKARCRVRPLVADGERDQPETLAEEFGGCPAGVARAVDRGTGGLLLARIFEEAGLPPGALSVVVGSGSDIGDAIVSHPAPSVVSFTGSTAVGENIVRTAGIKRLALELGGNGPFVVLDDADLAAATDAAVFGSFFHAGADLHDRQSGDRGPVGARRVHGAVHRAGGRAAGRRPVRPGDPCRPGDQPQTAEAIQDKVRRAESAGARKLLGGEPSGPSGLLLPPHVLLGDNEVATAKEEVFGPVITVIPARTTRCGWPTTPNTACPARSTPVTPTGSRPAWAIGEFTTEHWITVQREPRRFPI